MTGSIDEQWDKSLAAPWFQGWSVEFFFCTFLWPVSHTRTRRKANLKDGGMSMGIEEDSRDALRDLVINKTDAERLIFLKYAFFSRAMPKCVKCQLQQLSPITQSSRQIADATDFGAC
jgi:hypothetical protein